MPLVQLDTENADRDLTAQVTVLTHTPDASNPMWCAGLIYFGDGAKNLDGTGGSFEISVQVGSQVLEPDPQTVTFSTATRTCVYTTPFLVPANTQVLLKAKSPNGADTDVDVTAYLYDVIGAVVAASVTGAVGSVTGNVGGNVVGSVASVAGAVGSVAGNVDGNVTGSVGSVVGSVASVSGAVGSVAGNVDGNVTGTVGSVVGAVGSVAGNVDGNVTGSVGSLAAQAKLDVNAEMDGALNTAIPGAPTADSINERLATVDDAYTAARGAYLDELAAANLPTDVAAVDAAVAAVDAAIAALNDLSAAQVAAQVASELATYDGPTKAEMDTGHAAIETDTQDLQAKIGTPVALDGAAATVGGMIAKLADDNSGADFDAETDSLEKLRNKVNTIAGSGGGSAIPSVVLVPDGGSIDQGETGSFQIMTLSGDGQLTAPDALPTVAIVDPAGTAVSGLTVALISTGLYRVRWTVADNQTQGTHEIRATAVIGGNSYTDIGAISVNVPRVSEWGYQEG